MFGGLMAKMALTYGTPVLWLSYVRDARELADTIADPLARKVTLGIAESYEKKAESARARVMGIAQGDTN